MKALFLCLTIVFLASCTVADRVGARADNIVAHYCGTTNPEAKALLRRHIDNVTAPDTVEITCAEVE